MKPKPVSFHPVRESRNREDHNASCLQKRKFSTEREALGIKSGGNVYICECCGYYHLTSQMNRIE